jgi:hypothetical protein
MSNTYNLVNPYIKGTFETSIKTDNSGKAGKYFYKQISGYIGNSLPQFYFTVQKGGKGKYYHFKVSEKRDNDEVDYKLEPYTLKNESETISSFETALQEVKSKQSGGDKKSKKSKTSKTSKTSKKSKKSKKNDDDDSSDSDSDSDDFLYNYHTIPTWNTPINYMWYDPHVYSLNSMWMPSFYNVTPYVEIRTFFG